MSVYLGYDAVTKQYLKSLAGGAGAGSGGGTSVDINLSVLLGALTWVISARKR